MKKRIHINLRTYVLAYCPSVCRLLIVALIIINTFEMKISKILCTSLYRGTGIEKLVLVTKMRFVADNIHSCVRTQRTVHISRHLTHPIAANGRR